MYNICYLSCNIWFKNYDFKISAFGLKKFFVPLLIGAQVFKSIILAMFLPSILGSFGKILGKGNYLTIITLKRWRIVQKDLHVRTDRMCRGRTPSSFTEHIKIICSCLSMSMYERCHEYRKNVRHMQVSNSIIWYLPKRFNTT